MKAARARWDAEHPEELRAKRRNDCMIRRARKRNAFVEAVKAEEVFLRSDGICGICGGPVSREKFHVDHIIPLSKGGQHSYANTQAAHPLCNMRKGDSLAAV
jgi:5-methylcytosine-specific restriction endonuclease McrA